MLHWLQTLYCSLSFAFRIYSDLFFLNVSGVSKLLNFYRRKLGIIKLCSLPVMKIDLKTYSRLLILQLLIDPHSTELCLYLYFQHYSVVRQSPLFVIFLRQEMCSHLLTKLSRLFYFVGSCASKLFMPTRRAILCKFLITFKSDRFCFAAKNDLYLTLLHEESCFLYVKLLWEDYVIIGHYSVRLIHFNECRKKSLTRSVI